MANTPIEAIYVAMKTEYQPGIMVRYPYVFDEVNLPYIFMSQVDDELEKQFLSDTTGGVARITIGYLSTSFEDCVNQIETITTFARTLIGSYSPVTITEVVPTSLLDLTGLEQSAQKVYRRQFDLLVWWDK